ncbi:MAG TPA: PIN domain-containing protein [Desulfobacteraceae bacterium]|nr:PIN domain-containing protein [Desulfobacteraceae bacterium]
MILYLDTSALVKKYWSEEGSMDVIDWWREAEEIATSSVAYAEALSAFYRKRRETDGLSKKAFGTLMLSFKKDWKSLIRVHVTDTLNQTIEDLIGVYPLRGFDLIHLASALLIWEKTPENFVFACYDERLAEAARENGLSVLPEHAPDP